MKPWTVTAAAAALILFMWINPVKAYMLNDESLDLIAIDGKNVAEIINVNHNEKPADKNLMEIKDIKKHWAERHINTLLASGSVSGYPDGTFRPDKPVTRAEFTVLLVKNLKLVTKTGKVFADTSGHWAKDYIATAYAHGIINGYSDTRFGPDDLITREQMAVMIVKAKNLNLAAQLPAFADEGKISSWAYRAVKTAQEHSLIRGYPDNTFRPQGKATRAEAATVIVLAGGK